MQLYDMHTHILPAFDDGAKTVEDSLALIEGLKKQGVSHICLTPHFYTHEMSVEDYVAKRQEAFEVLRPQLPSDVEIVLGSEVYVTQYLFNSQDLNGITYGQSNYILVEFSYQCTFNETIMRQFDVLMRNHRLIPVLTHVERYDNLMSDPGLIEELKDDGVVIQTNISNYADKAPFFRKRKLLKFISNGLIDILGSDAHSFKHNTPEVFTQAMKNISQKCGDGTLSDMMANAEKIFKAAKGI